MNCLPRAVRLAETRMSNSRTMPVDRHAKVAGNVRATVAQTPNVTTILLDLGTSPLYTLQAIVHFMGNEVTPEAALGALSVIFWSLIITISIKYGLFVMRADNHGEGGILALMAMTGADWCGRRRWLVVFGLCGAALIYADGIITPAISVLSAVEGLNVATSTFRPYTMPIAALILVALFMVQSRGTAKVGKAFGPIMLILVCDDGHARLRKHSAPSAGA
jgi:KUP system potassium uptake protein